MRALTGELLLDAWERGAAEAESDRALALLSVALPDCDRAALETMPLIDLNARLLQLHTLTFGAMLSAVSRCRRCDEQLEFSVPVAELVASPPAERHAHAVTWLENGTRYELRSVTTADLRDTLAIPESGAAQELLLSRCLAVAPGNGSDPGPAPSTVREKFEQLNASAELRCAITCPGCCADELVDLDIGRFVWTEVRRAAKRLLGDVHLLARHYGWSERAILSLSAQRRAAYLEMVGA
jgi:hypothetical protein